jgi:hypothetical protein
MLFGLKGVLIVLLPPLKDTLKNKNLGIALLKIGRSIVRTKKQPKTNPGKQK